MVEYKLRNRISRQLLIITRSRAKTHDLCHVWRACVVIVTSVGSRRHLIVPISFLLCLLTFLTNLSVVYTWSVMSRNYLTAVIERLNQERFDSIWIVWQLNETDRQPKLCGTRSLQQFTVYSICNYNWIMNTNNQLLYPSIYCNLVFYLQVSW